MASRARTSGSGRGRVRLALPQGDKRRSTSRLTPMERAASPEALGVNATVLMHPPRLAASVAAGLPSLHHMMGVPVRAIGARRKKPTAEPVTDAIAARV